MSALPPLASEQTAIGEQTLVYGVAPITPRDRLAMRTEQLYLTPCKLGDHLFMSIIALKCFNASLAIVGKADSATLEQTIVILYCCGGENAFIE